MALAIAGQWLNHHHSPTLVERSVRDLGNPVRYPIPKEPAWLWPKEPESFQSFATLASHTAQARIQGTEVLRHCAECRFPFWSPIKTNLTWVPSTIKRTNERTNKQTKQTKQSKTKKQHTHRHKCLLKTEESREGCRNCITLTRMW